MTPAVVVACLLASAFFSAAEMAFIAANRIRLRHLAEQGIRAARGYMEAFQNPERLLSTAMMGVTIAHVTASANWITVSLEQLYGETELFGLPDLSAAQVAYARDLAMSWGVPASFTFRSDRTLLEEASGWQKNGHATDGKGIDHFFDVYGERILGALFAALQNA